ncbi:hypothetical protein [Nannocystis pusilla]|uniref:hypothetical protein n=1 Tax=Nannocystis pusilla TaxID=889268 RepID=UPI003DA4C6D3
MSSVRNPTPLLLARPQEVVSWVRDAAAARAQEVAGFIRDAVEGRASRFRALRVGAAKDSFRGELSLARVTARTERSAVFAASARAPAATGKNTPRAGTGGPGGGREASADSAAQAGSRR